MANISFQLNTTTGFTTAADAIANWGTGTDILAWADPTGPDLANGDTVYQTNDGNPDDANGTLGGPFVGNATDFFAFERPDNTIAAVQIDAAGVVSTLTTTTTTTTVAPTTTTTTLPVFDCTEAGLISFQTGSVGSTINVNNIAVDVGTATAVSPTTYQLGAFTYDVDIEIPNGYFDAGSTITCPTTVTATTTTLAPAIAWTNDTTYTAPSSGGSTVRPFTITTNSTAFNASDITPNPNTVAWISTNVSSTVSSGSIEFTINANPTAGSRSQTFTLTHPEDNSVQSTSLTIAQSQGNTLPIAPNFSRTMIENGTPITLPFASGSGWSVDSGQQQDVTDAEDSFGNGLTIEMISVPLNGNIQDANAQGTNLSAGAVLTTSNPSIVYTPNTNYTGTDTFSYKAVDSDGGETTGSITVTVNAPQNQPPVPGDDLYSINGYGSTSISIQKDLASAGSTDDNDNPALLTYTLCNSTGVSQTEAQVAASLQYGDFVVNQGVGAFTFTYTKKSSVNFNPNNSTQDEYFYYKVADTEGETSSAVGTITLRVLAPGNNPPTFSNPTFNATLDQWSSTGATASASDSNTGDTLTWSIVSGPTSSNGISNPGSLNLNSQTGAWQYEANYSISQADTITFVIQVYDGFDNAATPYTAQINITPTTAVAINYSAWVANSDEACSANKGNQGYLDTSQATDITQLAVGDIIYVDSGFNNELEPNNSNISWIGISQTLQGGVIVSKAVEILDGYKITNIIECEVNLGNAWELTVNFDEDVNDLCAGTYEYGGQTVWQNVINADDSNNQPVLLSQVVAAGGQIFTDEVIANTYLSNSAPAEFTALTGYYNDSTSSGDNKYFEFQQGAWIEGSGGFPQDCPPLIEFQTYDVGVYYNIVDPIRIDNVCLADTDDLVFTKLYFRANQEDLVQNLSEGDKLLYILQHNLVPFTSLEAANQVDYALSWPSTTFLASKVLNGIYSLDSSRLFAVWENYNSSGYTGNYSWKGVVQNDTDLLESSVGTASTLDTNIVLGTCSTQFERPASSSTFEIDQSTPSRENVFYAFLSCVARFQDGSPYWNLYVVDGLHKNTENGSSYIKELHDVVGNFGIINGSTMLECMSIQHKVIAVNIDDAQDILNNTLEYNNDSIRTVQVNPVDLGLSSAAVINYGYTDCEGCLMQTELPQTFTLATVEDADIINTSIPNFDLEKNYSLDDISKPLLRTNPKLSTNAKLVVNSNGKMYIEAIEATKELASVEYKKWAVNKDGEWSYDLQRFFKNTKTPADQIYKVKESYSNFAVQETFENQIEEDYHYGTVYNYSKIHDEDFRMMAPIWLDKNIPNKFVIFRVKDPIGTLDFDTQSNLDNIREILKNSEIVKTFDLSRDSELGTYIRNHIQSESFPKTPITMNFDKLQRSSFNGIDLENGGFTSKGEYLDSDFISQDSTLIDANELITSGFQRNKLACANLINLEFLFNDNAVTDYSVSRYFGLYVNDIDSGYGTLDSANTGRLKFKTINSYINNENLSAIPPYKLISETPTLGYAATSDKFYKISPKNIYNTSDLELNVEDSGNSIASEIKLAETGNSIDIKVDGKPGSDFVKVTILNNPDVNDGFAIFPSKEQTYRLKFTRLIPQQSPGQESWKFTIVNPTDGQSLEFGPIYITGQGIQGVANYIQQRIGQEDSITSEKLYPELYNNLNIEVESDRSIILSEKRASLKPLQPDFIPWQSGGVNNSIARIEELQVPYDIDNNTFFALDDIPEGGFGGVNFSNQGSVPQVTSAIVKSINSIDNGFTALSYDGADHFYIKTDIQGYRLLSAGIAIPNANANQWISVDANNLDVNNLLRLDINDGATNTINDSSIYYFNGGNSTSKSILVTLDSASDININDYINTKSRGIYNKVIDIVDDIERLPLQYKKIVLEKPNTIEAGEIKTYADNLVKLGLFSAFDIHDMNFDFYDTSNSNLKELIYETPANIAYEPEQDDSNDIYPFGSKDNTEYTLDPVDYFSGLSDILLEEQADEFNENQITSEFDRLQENYLKEYAINSRVVPSINKWVLKDSLTVREQPYYLNANEAFGRSNFAPDLSADGRNRLGMTHEWFYINNLPAYFKNNTGSDTNPVYRLNDSFSYINFMDNFEITPAIFKDTNYDYFDRFFVTEGFETTGDNNYKTFVKTDRQKKYTRVDGGNNTAFASTIFKGLKFTFKGRKEFTALNPVDFIKSSEFNGYRFSILLNVKTAQESNGVDYEVIQNKKFKFAVFMISLSLDDLWSDKTLNRKLLYELNHSLVWKSENLTFEYSDIKIDGALNLQDANFTDPSASNYLEVSGFQHDDGSFPQFLEQINKDDDSKFGNLIVKIISPFGEMFLRLNIARLDGQDTLVLTQPPKDVSDGDNGDGVDLNGDLLTPYANLQNIPGYLQSSAEYTYERGGINAYKSILDALAARDVATMLLREPNNITFTTVNDNGQVLNNQFVINLEDGTEVVKDSKVQTIPDTDKPESFKLFSGNIGYDLTDGFTYYPFLVRQNGGYTIDTKPVVTFTDVYGHMKTNTLQSTNDSTEILLEEQMYKHSLTDVDEINLAKDYYKRYNRCGVAFNLGFIYDGGTHDTQWGYIKNHFYRKVNEFNAASVTKLSTSTDKLPLYPLIGEVAIDKKDVHVFKSSWDKNYYTRSLSGGNIEQVPGTFETKEEKSYLASTIMKVKDSYNLLNFTSEYVGSEEEQDIILLDNTNNTDLVIFENKDRIVVDFYITDTIKDKLSSDGVLNAIQQYVAVADSAEDKTTLDDDAQLYIEENLVNLFSLNQIKLFTRRIKGQFSAFENATTIDKLDDGGYTQDQNFTFRAHEQKPLNFRLIYNKRLGYSYRIRPMIKITS